MLQYLGLHLTTIYSPNDGRDQAHGDSNTSKRNQTEAQEAAEESPEEIRKPPKKRMKTRVQQGREPAPAESEERDQVATTTCTAGGERQEASPATDKPVKGRGDSAWETLMNVAALVPPLSTEVIKRTTKNARKVSLGSTAATPSPAKTAQASPGSSYSSKNRAINNDVVPNEQRWYDMFNRLEKFKAKTGHCRVPNRYSGDPSLGSWVATQRRYYKNKALPMPADRVKKLTDLGFEWTTKDPRKVPWETRFEDLKAFKNKFGHADVPHEWEECPQLGFWTANMRQQYRYKQLGKKSSLTDARIELLNEIGFVWKMQGGRRKKSDPVARPNQGTSSEQSPPPLTQPSYSSSPPRLGTPKQLVLDPMSNSLNGVAMLGHVASAANYIPPPGFHSMHYHAHSMSSARADL